MTVGIALVGAGFMGRRHVLGYAALARAGYDRSRLEAIVDLSPATAEATALEAEALLGYRPRVYTNLEEVLANPEVHAIDLVTDPRTHHTIAVTAM